MITNCITVVLLPWIHSIKMQTFDSVCCDIVENCNIVTVFSTYIWILFALIIKLWWSFHLCPCALKVIKDALQNQNISVDSCYHPIPWHCWLCSCSCCMCYPATPPGMKLCFRQCMHLVKDSSNCSKSKKGSPGMVALCSFLCLWVLGLVLLTLCACMCACMRACLIGTEERMEKAIS